MNAKNDDDNFMVMPYEWATASGRRYNPEKFQIETATGYHRAFPVNPDGSLYDGVKVSREFFSWDN